MDEIVLSAEEVLAHPRFDEARAVYIKGMLGLREGQVFINQLLFDEGRIFAFFTLIMMHARFRQEDRESRPTVQALKRQMETLKVASARRVHDIIQRLVDVGFVDYRPMEKDGRVKVLTPTSAMLALDRQMLAVYFRPLSILYPENGYLEPLQDDPAFQRSVRQIGPEFMALFQQALQANATVSFFMPHQGGLLILTKLMQISLECDIESTPEISFVELADCFGTSRTHVRRLLKKAAKAGLVNFTASGVSVSHDCRAGFDRFVADTMRGHDFVYRFAKRTVSCRVVTAQQCGGAS